MTDEPPRNAGAQRTAADVIRLLDLIPHPEGGHFRETFRDASLVFPAARTGDGAAGRAASTAIYYLLARGERSHWHRTDAAEVWNWYAGAPPAHAWQAAQSLGDWTLVGCTVAPGFDFAQFELASKGWEPGGHKI